jgi:hypothetical protein
VEKSELWLTISSCPIIFLKNHFFWVFCDLSQISGNRNFCGENFVKKEMGCRIEPCGKPRPKPKPIGFQYIETRPTVGFLKDQFSVFPILVGFAF